MIKNNFLTDKTVRTIISDCVDLFGYSIYDFDDMNKKDVIEYLSEEQLKELSNYYKTFERLDPFKFS